MMIEAKLASIIVPTFNGSARIGNGLDALMKEVAGRDVEILVIDDGSTDNTGEVVGRYPAVRLITQANAGPAAARNRGAREAQGRILLFTDDDCVPLPGLAGCDASVPSATRRWLARKASTGLAKGAWRPASCRSSTRTNTA